MLKKTITAGMIACSLAIAMFTGVAGAHGDDSAPTSSKGRNSEINKGLAQVRNATAKYHDVNEAFNDGYINTHELAADPQEGVMGIHFVNPALLGDDIITPEKPEVLLYVPTKNGGYKLVGVEYYVPAALVTKTPSLFGQPFDGPMLNHELDPDSLTEDQKKDPKNNHYDLHVWIWHGNPSGIFAQYNPALKVNE